MRPLYVSGTPRPNHTLPQSLHTIPDGANGIRATLKIMAKIAREYTSHPLVRQFTQTLVQERDQKDRIGEIRTVGEFVRDHIRYVRDPVGTELVQTPEATMELKSGDCDDKSTLAAAMLRSIGHPVRFVAIGFAPQQYSHVFLETKIHRKNGGYPWMAVETTEPWPIGRAPVGFQSRMVQDV